MRRISLAMLAGACVAALAVMAGSATGSVAPPTLVSGPSPFAGCTHTGTGGTNYLNAEHEPWLAVNPANPNNIIAVYQQDRWSNGGTRRLLATVTHDDQATHVLHI